MTVMGIETATSICSVAIVRNGQVLSEKALDEKHIHAEKIVTLIDEALSGAQFSVTDIEGLAVSIGPGSFTGLRIGLSVAKGLAYALGLPLAAVPTLRALAQRVVDTREARPGTFVLPVLDARRDEVYCQCFKFNGSDATSLWPERAMTVPDLLDQIARMDVIVTGDARGKLAAALHERMEDGDRHITFAGEAASRCSAANVALLGEPQLARGKYADVARLEPLYVKEFYLKERASVHHT